MIKKTVKRNNSATRGHQLSGFNVYNAVHLKSYIVSEYFVMYEEGNEGRILHSDFVIEVDKSVVARAYRLEKIK